MRNLALVTGGSGFLGSYIVNELESSGWNVRILDLLPPETVTFDYLRADIRDLDACLQACDGVDVVFHNVAQVPLAKNRELFESVNIEGTRNILEASTHHNVNNFVYTSSSAVYGLPRKMPANSQRNLQPVEIYGQTKLRGEQLVSSYQEKIMNTSIVRPRTILGSGRLGLFSILFDWISEGLDVFVFDGGEHPYQFIHVDDLTKGIVSSASIDGHNIYNLGATTFLSLRADLEELCSHAKTGSRVRSISSVYIKKPALLAAKMGLLPFASYQLLLYSQEMYFDSISDWKTLAVSPQFSNAQALIESYEWYLMHRNSSNLLTEKSLHKSISTGKATDLMKLLLKLIK
jgi:nucleoside-diphosphate-sugar epimerase